MIRRRAIGRLTATFTVPLTLVAWFLLSNHCALGATVGAADSEQQMSGCPMHSAAGKKKSAPKTPCCKDLPAVLAKCVNATMPGVRLVWPRDDAPDIFQPLPRVPIEIEGLDTGPPGRVSFAELVLQESMLAHAPPVS